MRPPIRVILVDDHALVMAGYARLLALEDDIVVAGEYTSADAAYRALQHDPGRADVMVLDLSMPGRSGLDLMQRLPVRCPNLRVVACTMHDSAAMVAQAMRAGAWAFITKSSDPALLADAIRRVATGERVLSPDVDNAADRPGAGPPHEALSAREFDVLLRLARGDSIDQIAQAMRIAPKTAANLQALIRAKLGLSSALDLLRYARQHRIVFD